MTNSVKHTQCTPVQRGLVVPPGNLVVHPRWKGSQLMQYLTGKVQVLYVGDTGICDFHPACKTSVIYITENDIISDADYKRRIAKLRNAYGFTEKHVLIDKTALTVEKFVSVQQFVVLDCDMSIFPVEEIKQAAEILSQMVSQAMKSPGRNPYVSKNQELSCNDADVLSFVETFPQIGNIKAKLLLDKFETIEGIVNASLHDLSTVVGRSSAQSLFNFLS